MNTFALAPLILVFPVIGILFNGLVGRRFVVADRKSGERWSGWFATAMVFGAFLVSLSLLGSEITGGYHAEIIPLFTWINIPSADFYVPWAMQIDTLSVTMMLVVTGVGALIHMYAIGYMHDDVRHNGDPSRYRRFFVFFNLFIVAMMILVSADPKLFEAYYYSGTVAFAQGELAKAAEMFEMDDLDIDIWDEALRGRIESMQRELAARMLLAGGVVRLIVRFRHNADHRFAFKITESFFGKQFKCRQKTSRSRETMSGSLSVMPQRL